jgi:hypothetical protein
MFSNINPSRENTVYVTCNREEENKIKFDDEITQEELFKIYGPLSSSLNLKLDS